MVLFRRLLTLQCSIEIRQYLKLCWMSKFWRSKFFRRKVKHFNTTHIFTRNPQILIWTATLNLFGTWLDIIDDDERFIQKKIFAWIFSCEATWGTMDFLLLFLNWQQLPGTDWLITAWSSLKNQYDFESCVQYGTR